MIVTITTSIPSPYQVELFNALQAGGVVDIRVIYETRRGVGRQWDASILTHQHCFLNESSMKKIKDWLSSSELVIFSGYRNAAIRRLIVLRQNAARPWVFWAERPGFKVPSFISRYYRRITFPALFKFPAPIWGIGDWAVAAYRAEIGSGCGERTFLNVPYFSNLERFFSIDRKRQTTGPTRILFSGSLIKRKGVDLLASAFASLCAEGADIELHLLGDGPLRHSLEKELLSFSNRVHFHGFKQWDELPNYYAQADILCAPSRYDGWGLIIPEGLAAGLMVVSTNKTGAALELLDSETGWVAKAGSLTSLTKALQAAVSVGADERIARIERGRAAALKQDVNSGVRRVYSAISSSIGG